MKSAIAARCDGGNGPDDTVDDFVNAVVAADSKACSYLTPDGLITMQPMKPGTHLSPAAG